MPNQGATWIAKKIANTSQARRRHARRNAKRIPVNVQTASITIKMLINASLLIAAVS